MASVDDFDFSTSDSGSSDTIPMEAGQIRKGGLIMIKGNPCKVSEVSTSKTGKHGHAKCNFIAYQIFNNKKFEDMIPSTHGTTVPVVTRTEYTLIDINDEDFMSLMSASGDMREDLKLPSWPENYAHELRTEFDKGTQLILTVLKACGQEQVMSHKVDTEA
mmetsp:Transcript_53499/g.68671  ORF Transcript_53499/g.68671 Transcript_53499/m.68671 type:complete len:161 (+) Transcript_53499:60-542(+)